MDWSRLLDAIGVIIVGFFGLFVLFAALSISLAVAYHPWADSPQGVIAAMFFAVIGFFSLRKAFRMSKKIGSFRK